MDKLDRALALYAEQYVKEEAAYFLGLDVSGIEYNEQIKKRMLRYAFKRSRYEYKRYTVKVILVACLVAMSVAFTACVSIPKIREAIWGVVIEWYDDHISVKFEEITEQTVETTILPETSKDQSSAKITDETETSTNTAEVIAPPKTIEQKAYIANLPEGYYAEEGAETSYFYTVNYYETNGELSFCFSQSILSSANNYLDAENTSVIRTELNGNQAILIIDKNAPSLYTLLWTDGIYDYSIYGLFDSLTDLLDIARYVQYE